MNHEPAHPLQAAAPRVLDPAKFRDPVHTAKGEVRAQVALKALEVLWVNTGTLCNLACTTCYIESSPRNDRLDWFRTADLTALLDEIETRGLPTRTIGFTGGEPMMNPDILPMLDAVLSRGHEALVLTNAMTPLRHRRAGLLDLKARHGDRLTLRVSLDHHGRALHEAERGPNAWAPAIEGLVWLVRSGFRVTLATRLLGGEGEPALRAGFARLFTDLGVALDAGDPATLVVFPQMDEQVDVPEITEACWGILGVAPDSPMCATSRMAVRRKGADAAAILACTLIAYDPAFELGTTLSQAEMPVALNHPHCARFCVLGGASCAGA